MVAVPASAFPDRQTDPSVFDGSAMETRSSLAMDAITHGKPHAVQAAEAYFLAVTDALSAFPVVQARDGAFDARMLVTLDNSKVICKECRKVVLAISEAENAAEFSSAFCVFFTNMLTVKKRYRLDKSQAFLWRDSLRFIARELFLTTVGVLLAQQHWKMVREIVDHQYRLDDGGTHSFVAFDGFARSLDVFRNRRLKLQRVAVSADILKERAEEDGLAFDVIITADFVLHLMSRARDDRPTRRWQVRTLAHAQDFQLNGFDLFMSARGDTTRGQPNECLSVLFDQPDWASLHALIGSWPALSPTPENPAHLDYSAYLAANNPIFS